MTTNNDILDNHALDRLSKKIRAEIIEIAHETETIHIGGCLSCVDILVALYFGCLSVRPKNRIGLTVTGLY